MGERGNDAAAQQTGSANGSVVVQDPSKGRSPSLVEQAINWVKQTANRLFGK